MTAILACISQASRCDFELMHLIRLLPFRYLLLIIYRSDRYRRPDSGAVPPSAGLDLTTGITVSRVTETDDCSQSVDSLPSSCCCDRAYITQMFVSVVRKRVCAALKGALCVKACAGLTSHTHLQAVSHSHTVDTQYECTRTLLTHTIAPTSTSAIYL